MPKMDQLPRPQLLANYILGIENNIIQYMYMVYVNICDLPLMHFWQTHFLPMLYIKRQGR